MPFGLRNASATFQRYMDKVLQGMKNAIAYVDDIIVFSSSEDQHKRDLNELFQRFHRHKIVINPAKSKFGMCNLNFLGHLVTPEGILPLRDKVKAVEDYPRPYNHKQLRAFLGFINYYHRFVHNMAHHLAPLYNLLKNSKSKNQVIDWNDEAVQAFQHSKKMLAEATALAFPSSNLPTQIVVDASDIAIGAVLQQKHEEVWRPIAFFSRKLDATQKNTPPLIENCFQHTRLFGISIT